MRPHVGASAPLIMHPANRSTPPFPGLAPERGVLDARSAIVDHPRRASLKHPLGPVEPQMGKALPA
jgi:hypothetical protein